jgi:hypothetical protein
MNKLGFQIQISNNQPNPINKITKSVKIPTPVIPKSNHPKPPPSTIFQTPILFMTLPTPKYSN